MKRSKRFLAMLLSVATIVCMMPAMAFADTEVETEPVVVEEQQVVEEEVVAEEAPQAEVVEEALVAEEAPEAEVVEEELDEAKKKVAPEAAELTYDGTAQQLIAHRGDAKWFKFDGEVYSYDEAKEAIVATDADKYTVEYSFDAKLGKKTKWKELTVRIHRADVTAKWTPVDKPVYNGQAMEPTVVLEGLIGEDASKASLKVKTYAKGRIHSTDAVNAGSYETYAYLKLEDTKTFKWDWSDNYDFNLDSELFEAYVYEWTIAPKQLDFAVSALTYDGYNQNSKHHKTALSAFEVLGLVGEDAATVFEIDVKGSKEDVIKHADTYDVKVYVNFVDVDELDNYVLPESFNYDSHDVYTTKEVLTVNPAELAQNWTNPTWSAEGVTDPTLEIATPATPDAEYFDVKYYEYVDENGKPIEVKDAGSYNVRAYLHKSFNGKYDQFNNDYNLGDIKYSYRTGRYYYTTVVEVQNLVALEGVNNEYTIGKDGNLTFKSSGDLSQLVMVLVDGTVVTPDNYELTEGSTIVTLENVYLKTLKAGVHTLTMVYQDGRTVDFAFTVKSGVDTGDSNDMMPWAIALMVSMFALAGYGLKRREN